MISIQTPGYLELTYTIAKKEFEIASMYLSDTYQYVTPDLHLEISKAQTILDGLSEVMQDRIDKIKNSGQPEK